MVCELFALLIKGNNNENLTVWLFVTLMYWYTQVITKMRHW